MITAQTGLPDYSDFVANNLNQLIIFPEGVFPFKKAISIVGRDKLSITGAGMGLTYLKDFQLDIKTNQDWNNLFFNIRDTKITGKLTLQDCCYACLENVLFEQGDSITMKGVWDTLLHNVHFSQCTGMVIDERVGKCAGIPQGSQSNCITILKGRFEGCTTTPLTIRNSRKIVIDGVKFHGSYPNPKPIDHLVLDHVTASMVEYCNFTVGGKSYVNLNYCSGIDFNNIMDNPAQYAFENSNSDKITIHGIIAAHRMINNYIGTNL